MSTRQLERIIGSIKNPRRLLYSDTFIYKQISRKRKHVFLISAPKSGSTWTSRVLSSLLKWEECRLLNGYDRRAQEIDLRKLVSLSTKKNIFSPNQHIRMSSQTLEAIRQARIEPIIQMRNIFDTAISLKDHITHEGPILPMAYIDHNWLEMDSTMQLDFIIDMVIPWYFNFCAGWLSCDLVKKDEIFIIHYEKMISDPVAHIHDCCARIGQPRTREDIAKVLGELANSKKTRKNVGVSGRGRKQLSQDQKDRIIKMSLYYPDVDFSPIGIDKPAK